MVWDHLQKSTRAAKCTWNVRISQVADRAERFSPIGCPKISRRPEFNPESA
jgi:hypothetical protein